MNRRQVIAGGAAAFCLAWPETSEARMKLHVPPEEDPHELTFMQWPVSRKVHPDPGFLELLQETIADIANAIVEFFPKAGRTSVGRTDETEIVTQELINELEAEMLKAAEGLEFEKAAA